jgi:hypothetical protein
VAAWLGGREEICYWFNPEVWREQDQDQGDSTEMNGNHREEVQPGINPRIKNQASCQESVNQEAQLSRGSPKTQREKRRTVEGIERKRQKQRTVLQISASSQFQGP